MGGGLHGWLLRKGGRYVAQPWLPCPCHAAGAGVAPEVLEQQLRRALYLASRTTDKRVAAAACAAYTFLQRAAAGSPAEECRAKVGLPCQHA